jgi:hypothetical protein
MVAGSPIRIRDVIAPSYPMHGTCARGEETYDAGESRSGEIGALAPNLLGSTSNRRFQIRSRPMSDSIFRAGTRARSFRHLLLLSMLAPLVWSCAGKRPAEPIADGQGRLRGYGFTIEPPRGKDWTVAEHAYDSVVYIRSSDFEGRRKRGGRSLAQASLGVVALPAGGTASADESGFAKAALNFLSDRFRGQPRVKLLDLKTAPYSLHGALCAGFEAIQVERYSARRNNGSQLELLNRGFLCRHPDNRTVVVHGFFNKINRRVATRLRDGEIEREADRFLESVIFSPLR